MSNNITKDSSKLCAIYLRVSTQDQVDDGYGLDYQLAKCEMVANLKEWDVYKVYSDKGISGTKDVKDRNGLKQIIRDAKAKRFDALIFYSLDRLGRNTRIVLNLVQQLADLGVTIYSHKETLDTSTSTGIFVLTMFAALAQLERDNIVERTTNGLHQRGLTDGEMGGGIPYGYYRGETGIRVNAKTLSTVLTIFQLRDFGDSLREIADFLNRRGIPTPKNGKQWYKGSVRVILNNREKYEGGKRGMSEVRWPNILKNH